jgi:hypothetical protein
MLLFFKELGQVMSRSSTTEKEIENGKQDNGSNPPPDEIGHVWYGQAVQQS